MSGKDALMTVGEKPLSATKITVSQNQMKWIRNIVVILVPLLVAVIGIIVYLRRKNR